MKVQRLDDEVNDLKNNEDAYRSRSDNQPPADQHSSLSAKQPAVATVFIFHDGRHISATNYAVAGQTLWIFGENVARKFPLSEVDIQATEQSNAVNGIEVRLPGLPGKQ